MGIILDRFPENTLFVAKVDETVYNKSITAGWDMYPIKPPFYVCIYFFPSDVYLLNYDAKTLEERCCFDGDLLMMEFKYLIRQLFVQDPKALSLLFFEEHSYIYKDFYGRAVLDYKHLFLPETYDVVEINKLFKEMMYDYVVSNRTDK